MTTAWTRGAMGTLISTLALALCGGCGNTAGGGGGAGMPPTMVGGKPGLACSKDGHHMGCFLSTSDGGGTVVKCNPDTTTWDEVQVCAAGLKCVEEPKPGGPIYIKTASCKVDNGPATDTAAQDGGNTDGSTTGDGTGSGGDGKLNTSGDAKTGDGGDKVTDGGTTTDGGMADATATKDIEPLEDNVEPDVPFLVEMDASDSGGNDGNTGDVIIDVNPGDGGGSDGGGTKKGTCKGKKCEFNGASSCQCDDECAQYKDCCVDKKTYCPPKPS